MKDFGEGEEAAKLRRPATSALKEENFRMVATPFLATLFVLLQ